MSFSCFKGALLRNVCACVFLFSPVRKLFQDDAAVKNGVLQVFVRMKPVPDTIDTCMVLDPNHLLKATWCAPELLSICD
jgi:hypothetical protein